MHDLTRALTPGDKLRALREAQGLATRDMVEQRGMSSTGAVANLEMGRHAPRFDSVEKYAAAYGLTPMEFCGLWFGGQR